VDTTVVETNIHYPPDSSLWGTARGTDAHHEEDQVEVGRSERQSARSHAQYTEASPGDCLIDSAARSEGEERRKHFEVFAERPADSTLLLSSIEVHQQTLGRIPRMVAADAGFIRARTREWDNSWGAVDVGPQQENTSSERKLLQHQRWFRSGQKWRTGSEGRISVLKRKHGLRRCLYPGLDGMRRW